MTAAEPAAPLCGEVYVGDCYVLRCNRSKGHRGKHQEILHETGFAANPAAPLHLDDLEGPLKRDGYPPPCPLCGGPSDDPCHERIQALEAELDSEKHNSFELARGVIREEARAEKAEARVRELERDG